MMQITKIKVSELVVVNHLNNHSNILLYIVATCWVYA